MKVLVIGSGGREHALAWKLSTSPRVNKVYVAPGNGGTAALTHVVNVDITAPSALADFVVAEGVTLTVVGPEAPLAAGVVDLFRERGLRIFGPTRAAAQLESSKAFAKDFMARHGIPTAAYQTFGDPAAAHAYVDQRGAPIVIKADGLAAGKGVVVAMTASEAHEAIDFMLLDNTLGVAHNDGQARVVIEEFLQGEEASFHRAVRRQERAAVGHQPGPQAPGRWRHRPQHRRHGRVLAGAGGGRRTCMRGRCTRSSCRRWPAWPRTAFRSPASSMPGLMIDAHGAPKTVEFNARLGDPETQPILMRLKSDLAEVLLHATDGTLGSVELQWDRRFALGVVMAAAGYPLNPRKGDVVKGLPRNADDAHVFHAGTVRRDDGSVEVTGGRVLCVTALGESARAAQHRAYEVLDGISFDGMQLRRDIGYRAHKALNDHIADVRRWLLDLQQRIVAALEAEGDARSPPMPGSANPAASSKGTA